MLVCNLLWNLDGLIDLPGLQHGARFLPLPVCDEMSYPRLIGVWTAFPWTLKAPGGSIGSSLWRIGQFYKNCCIIFCLGVFLANPVQLIDYGGNWLIWFGQKLSQNPGNIFRQGPKPNRLHIGKTIFRQHPVSGLKQSKQTPPFLIIDLSLKLFL